MKNAIAKGHPTQLHRITDKKKISKNRYDSGCTKMVKPPGQSCDEYPFASSQEGEHGIQQIREMFVLERCLYQRDVCIRGMSVLQRCLYQRDVCNRQMSVLERCLYIREMSVLERCLYIREMSVLEGCLYQRDVCIKEMSVLEGCLYQRDVCSREMSDWLSIYNHVQSLPTMKNFYVSQVELVLKQCLSQEVKTIYKAACWEAFINPRVLVTVIVSLSKFNK